MAAWHIKMHLEAQGHKKEKPNATTKRESRLSHVSLRVFQGYHTVDGRRWLFEFESCRGENKKSRLHI